MSWIVALLVLVLTTLLQLPTVKLEGYRPDDKTFFYMLLFVGMVERFLIWGNKQTTEANLKNKYVEELKYYKDALCTERIEALNNHLQEIAESLGFEMQERICVYRFLIDGNDKFFQCIGRYSAHPDYNELVLTKRYPSKRGIIGSVWSQGQHNGFIKDKKIPNPNNTNSYYRYLSKKYYIPEDLAKKWRMNPVDLIAEVIRDTKNKPVAVIIFESQRKNFLDENKIKQVYSDFKKSAIITSLDKLKEQHSPDSAIAREAQI